MFLKKNCSFQDKKSPLYRIVEQAGLIFARAKNYNVNSFSHSCNDLPIEQESFMVFILQSPQFKGNFDVFSIFPQ